MNRYKFVSVLIIIIFLSSCGYFVYKGSNSLDGIKGEILCLLYGDDAEYTPGYSDKAFRKIKVGMTESETIKILGPPFEKSYTGYYPHYDVVIFETDLKLNVSYVTSLTVDFENKIKIGMSEEEVIKIIGHPKKIQWRYSRPQNNDSFRARYIYFRKGKVSEVFHEFYVD